MMQSKTWLRVVGEMIGTLVVIVLCILVVGMIGHVVESMGDRQEARERCLKKAVNQYESQRCR